jgi:hypothetical protein
VVHTLLFLLFICPPFVFHTHRTIECHLELDVQALEAATPAQFKPAPRFDAYTRPRPPMPPLVTDASHSGSFTPPVELKASSSDLAEAPPFEPLEGHDEGFSAGKIAGLVLGLLIPILLMALLVWSCMFVRRRRLRGLTTVCSC